MIDLPKNRDKLIYCGDLVYHYEYFGTARELNHLSNYYPGSNAQKILDYKRYLQKTDEMMRNNKILLESQNLPLCLGDIFVLTPEQFGIKPPSEASLDASKRRLRDLINTNFGINPQPSTYPLFLTLTYKNPQFSPTVIKTHLELFIKRLRYHTKIKFRYIAIPEKHQSSKTQADRYGSFHYHILLFDMPIEVTKDQHTIRKFNYETTEIWGHGFTYLKKCYGSPSSVAGYVNKYLEKDLSIEVGRRYLASYNCWKPIETDDLSTAPPLQYITSSTYTLLSGEYLKLTINKIHHI